MESAWRLAGRIVSAQWKRYFHGRSEETARVRVLSSSSQDLWSPAPGPHHPARPDRRLRLSPGGTAGAGPGRGLGSTALSALLAAGGAWREEPTRGGARGLCLHYIPPLPPVRGLCDQPAASTVPAVSALLPLHDTGDAGDWGALRR